ncbi:site-specific integrase [Alicyclobacillus dauci]|uniref:Site-specific integrase n=1 Tax=Alicyclobacillus dauci TaxID=1475485 RepID=A0ABY6Z796_9BACL|nr:site-specific integrase [Alicyclobacillus dauci]WAH38664.1 site-specific integrase [Alicyclobacillus dauci]
MGFKAFPADDVTIGRYISYLALLGRKKSTIRRHLTSIAEIHRMNGVEDVPTQSFAVKRVWKGIRNDKRDERVTKKAATLIEDIRAMVAIQPNSMLGLRNKLILLIGYAGSFRRSEIVGLKYEDVKFVRNGVEILLRHSKTDQEGEGRKLAIGYGSRLETCPVRNLQEWFERTGIDSGFIFRRFTPQGRLTEYGLSPQTVALIVKDAARAAGLPNAEDYSGHSLRAGAATQGAKNKADALVIMKQTGHKSRAMLDEYIREGSLWDDTLTNYLGL